ncbi:MAG: response regulator transcription factor [Chloroflexi bacterium]|nr:response regulator transcription factor [Chloroflexota bacterium]
MSKIKLILADDHAVVRSGLRMLLEAQTDMEIIGEAENGREAVTLAQSLQPDIILMDILMPDMNGIEATRLVKEAAPDTAVLALTMHEDEQYFFEMLKAGASGYIPKRAAPDDLVAAIRTINRGEVYLFPSLAARLVQDFVNRQKPATKPLPDNLTAREQEVLGLIAEGLTNPQIALQLGISVKTVDRHRENLMRKLNMHSRIALVKYAIKKGLIDLDD